MKEELINLFEYTVEFGLEDSQIYCKPNALNDFSTLIKVEPCKHGFVEIHLGLSAHENDRLHLDHLIYLFSVESQREIEDIYNEAKSSIQKYIERLKFDFENPSLKLRGGASATHGNCKYEFLLGGALCGGILESRIIHSFKNFAGKVIKTKESLDLPELQSRFVEEYIERFNSIEQIHDHLLKLISLASLLEYIKHTIEVLGVIYQKKAAPKILNEEDEWVEKARHFVAHGVIKSPKTLEILRKRLGTSDQELSFDRKNPSHMKIVNDAIEVYTISIKKFIDHL